MVSIEEYNSAEEAFLSLNIGKKLNKRHATRRCKALEKALNNNHWTKYAVVADYPVIFQGHPFWSLLRFNKSIKIGQVNDSDDILLFGDQYNCPDMMQLKATLFLKGIIIEPFIKKYTKPLTKSYFSLSCEKMICDGYNFLYRGNLYGFVIKAENTTL